jgi:hypothetical protein
MIKTTDSIIFSALNQLLLTNVNAIYIFMNQIY